MAENLVTNPPSFVDEEWRAVPGLSFYQASDLGRIRSLDHVLEFDGRWGMTRRLQKGRVLKLKRKPNGWGSVYWSFYAGEAGGYWQVNRAVCMAFKGLPPSAIHEAAHLDGDTNNNFETNLLWATPVENAAHKIGHGTIGRGVKNAMNCLTEREVLEIFEAYCRGEGATAISQKHDVSRGAIIGIVSGRAWSHLDVEDLRDRAKQQAKANLESSWEQAAKRRSERGSTLRNS